MKQKFRNATGWPIVISSGQIVDPSGEIMVDTDDLHDRTLVDARSLVPVIDRKAAKKTENKKES